MNSNSLLGELAKECAPLLLAPRADDPDAVVRRLRILPADGIYRCSSRDGIITPYVFSSDAEHSAPPNHSLTPEQSGSVVTSDILGISTEVCPLQTALSFASVECVAANQKHLFELNVFLQLLRQTPASYTSSLFWSVLIRRLGELGFYEIMKGNINTLWARIGRQLLRSGEMFNALRLLQTSCDVVLHYSEHAVQYPPDATLLGEFAVLARQMWAESSSPVVRRCALVVSAFLTKFADLVPLDLLSDASETKRDAPHLLAVVAKAPTLFKEEEETAAAGENLRVVLTVAFTTTAYSIPTTMYFRGEGPQSASLSLVQHRFASALHQLLVLASYGFWDHFSAESLLSLTEASAVYSPLWNSFPPKMFTLWGRICQNNFVTSCKMYTSSLFNYCISAAAYHYSLGELEGITRRYAVGDVSHGGEPSSTEPLQAADEGQKRGRQQEQHEDVSERILGSGADVCEKLDITPHLRETFRLMVTGWGSFQPGDRNFLRSGLVVLHVLLLNYPYQLEELGKTIGFDVGQLLHGIVMGLLASDVDSAQIMETVYSIIFRFYEMFDIFDVVSNLLPPQVMADVGLKCETTEKALMQAQLYGALLETHGEDISPLPLLEAATHISRGAILRFSSATSFFVKWFTVTERSLLLQPQDALVDLFSLKGTGDKLVQCLCEGALALVRELQSGNVIIDGFPVAPVLESVISCISSAVLYGGQQNALVACAIAVHGEGDVPASLMLFCLVFAANANITLLESSARLLAYVVEHSDEGLFTTLRLHTSIEMKKRLLVGLHQQLGSAGSADSTGARMVRLATLHHLLRFDPAAFYYLMAAEDHGKESAELRITPFLRDVVKSSDTTALEKSEALACLKALDDVGVSTTEVATLLSNMRVDSPITGGVLTAAAVYYACGVYFHKYKLDGGESNVAPTGKGVTQRLRLSDSFTVNMMQGKVLVGPSDEACKMLKFSCEALKQCITFYEQTAKHLRYGDANNVTVLPSIDSYPAAHSPLVLSVAGTAGRSAGCTDRRCRSLVDPRQMCNGQATFSSCLLAAEGISMWEGVANVDLDRLASALVAITRLTTSIEAALWILYGEKEVDSVTAQLLEAALCAVQMLGSPVPQLRDQMSACLDGALTLAQTAAVILTRMPSDGNSLLRTAEFISLFSVFVKTLSLYRDDDDVISRGLKIVGVFKPVEVADEEVVIHIFDTIASVVERHASSSPTDFLVPIVAQVTVIFTSIGEFCPTKCALGIVNNLWSCAMNVSQMIVIADPCSPLSNKFDVIVEAVRTILLQCDGILGYLSYDRIMPMATALGQLSNASCYDALDHLYKPQAWHGAWLSLLRLFHAVLIGCGGGSENTLGWLSIISSWATTSPRFREAVSGFTYCRGGVSRSSGPHSWEWQEMHIATLIISLLSSLGTSTAPLTPHVQRCFCRIRHFTCQTTGTPCAASLDELFLATVRHQLSYLILHSPPSGYMEGEPPIVTISRYRYPSNGEASTSDGLLLQKAAKVNEGDQKEEQLSFYTLRCFIFRELSILRKSCRDDSSATGALTSPDNTPVMRSSSLNTSTDGFSDIDVRDGGLQVVAPHLLNVQLALILFVRNGHFQVFQRCLDLWEQQELVEGLDELHRFLNLLSHYARRLESTKLISVVETVQEELQGLAERLRSGATSWRTTGATL
ncbi:hypothetical protein, conserved [Trypanosoma brucei gambiense DAL972]|uniref:Nucleoporin n=1 Tax=Trypanosoma brucei gambiense (strain MHOM/CI/86/DAL972) TaxID=679716 RepID=D0A403_TRYB9|nr:hypothetical protein, conserved [Trypanosoma brucei gambiense DAL972]CBH15997.1 hypothetical protein, conserved [Trypanosoma brucei gambiense DAL972]|eukprot:XP_011778261.1 hypothetical protein, conserved [Trypanosoma brucei gambiense DAL972]